MQNQLTSFDGDPVGADDGLDEGETDGAFEGALLGFFEGDWLGLDEGCETHHEWNDKIEREIDKIKWESALSMSLIQMVNGIFKICANH